MKTYSTLDEIINALCDGKKLCKPKFNLRNIVKNHEYRKIIYFYTNPQFNRCFAVLDNGETIEEPINIFDLTYGNEWVEYSDLHKDDVKELSVEEIEKKLGYKVKIVSEKKS